jgi:hypothetical protein
LRSESTLIEQHFFMAPAMSAESDVRTILELVDSRPDVLPTAAREPGLIAQLDAARARKSSPVLVETNSMSFRCQMRNIYTGHDGRWTAVFAWLLSLFYGFGLIVFGAVALIRVRRASAAHQVQADASETHEVRRLRVTQHWEREAHIEQLAPGTSLTNTTRFRLGITEAQTRDLTLNLGMNTVGVALPELAVRLANTRLTEESREIEKTIQLSNDRTGFYRRIALWRRVDAVHIDALVVPDGLRWLRRSMVEYYSSSSVATSFVDIPAG